MFPHRTIYKRTMAVHRVLVSLLLASLGLVCLVFPLAAQEPSAPSPQPSDFIWQEIAFGTGGAYAGGLGGLWAGGMLGGCASLGDTIADLAKCVLASVGGYVLGNTLGATLGVTIAGRLYGVEGNSFLAFLGGLGGTVGGAFAGRYLPSGIPSLAKLAVPAFSASLLAVGGFNLGARLRKSETASLMSFLDVDHAAGSDQ